MEDENALQGRLLDNKYAIWYQSLMGRAVNREIVDYTEKHHILPKCMGGNNGKNNIVRVTPREHFIAHACLVRCTSGRDRHKMIWAFNAMGYGRCASSVEARQGFQKSRVYQRNRIAFVEDMRLRATGRVRTMESRQKQSAAMKGRKLTPEHAANISRGLKGRKKSPEWVDKINRNPEKIAKMAAKHRGTKRTPEQRARMGRKKGCPAWNKGLKMTPEQRVNSGRKKGCTSWRKGLENSPIAAPTTSDS